MLRANSCNLPHYASKVGEGCFPPLVLVAASDSATAIKNSSSPISFTRAPRVRLRLYTRSIEAGSTGNPWCARARTECATRQIFSLRAFGTVAAAASRRTLSSSSSSKSSSFSAVGGGTPTQTQPLHPSTTCTPQDRVTKWCFSRFIRYGETTTS